MKPVLIILASVAYLGSLTTVSAGLFGSRIPVTVRHLVPKPLEEADAVVDPFSPLSGMNDAHIIQVQAQTNVDPSVKASKYSLYAELRVLNGKDNWVPVAREKISQVRKAVEQKQFTVTRPGVYMISYILKTKNYLGKDEYERIANSEPFFKGSSQNQCKLGIRRRAITNYDPKFVGTVDRAILTQAEQAHESVILYGPYLDCAPMFVPMINEKLPNRFDYRPAREISAEMASRLVPGSKDKIEELDSDKLKRYFEGNQTWETSEFAVFPKPNGRDYFGYVSEDVMVKWIDAYNQQHPNKPFNKKLVDSTEAKVVLDLNFYDHVEKMTKNDADASERLELN